MIGRKPALTAEQMQELKRWAEIGTSRTEVARRFGVDRRIVGRYLRGGCKRFNRLKA